jgi:hypothetical protein
MNFGQDTLQPLQCNNTESIKRADNLYEPRTAEKCSSKRIFTHSKSETDVPEASTLSRPPFDLAPNTLVRNNSSTKPPIFTKILPATTDFPNSTILQKKHLRKRKPRKKPEQSSWELHYRYLSKFILPYHYTHRCDSTFRHLWQMSCRDQRNKYIRDPIRCRSQHARLAFISSQRKRVARETHERRRQQTLQKRRRQRLYKLAYLRFKKYRIETFKRMGRLSKAYRLGWSAFREWLAWKGAIQMSEPRWRRRRRKKWVVDEIELASERRLFEMYRYPGKI